jgi:catechol 2,3-dioxygenase-like lactoylglutathione lyase family enzyme
LANFALERTDFITLPVTDLTRSKEFYEVTLGLENTASGGWPEYQLGENISVYLMDPTNIGQEFRGPHTAHIALRVPDVAAGRRDLEQQGVQFDGDILDTGVCHMAFFKDPDGNQFMLHRRYAPKGA